MIEIQEERFDPGEVVNQVTASSDGGAVVSFLGQVRAVESTVENDAASASVDKVEGLYLEHHPTMTRRSIEAIIDKARARWPIQQARVIHRIGTLKPGEPIVLVCVSADHRRDAFEAADFLMDYLKTEALFWKKEIRRSGSEWIEPRGADYTDTKRWSIAPESET